MATDLEKKAKGAFMDDHFQLSVDLYTQAIDIDPSNAEFYADRAQANIKLYNFTEAVADASKAIELAPSMAKAYLRKATACMRLEEYETAKAALEKGAALEPADSRFTDLIKGCDKHIAEETGDVQNEILKDAPTDDISTESVQPLISNEDIMIPVVKPKFRHEFFQKPEEVVVTIFAKGIPKQSVVVDFGEQILSVSIDIPGEEAYHFQPRLFGKIIPDKCRYDVMNTKVEIRLAKSEPLQWSSLEYSKEITVLPRANLSSGTKSQRPSYPSSKPTKDWDKLEAEMKKQEKEEKLDGDAALNKFFQDIYADADEDTRRAMQKSFVESNGTVLSTNWKEVGSKKVEGSPPDGMEMRKWEY